MADETGISFPDGGMCASDSGMSVHSCNQRGNHYLRREVDQLRARNAELEEEAERLNKMRVHCENCGADYMATGIESGCPCKLTAEVARLRKALEAAPVKLLHETEHQFLLRYKQWYRSYKQALEASDEG